MTADPDLIERSAYEDLKRTHPDVSDMEMLVALQRARQETHEWEPSPNGFDRRIHDWRAHVGEAVARTWAAIPVEVRVAIALDAETKAGAEEWE